MEPFESFEHWGVKVELFADYDAGNPYEQMDMASRIVGLEPLHRAGMSEEPYPTWEDRDLPVLARWLTVFGGEAVAIPFVFSDYGSGGYRARLTEVDNDRAAGFVCVSREKMLAEWPEGGTIDDECPDCGGSGDPPDDLSGIGICRACGGTGIRPVTQTPVQMAERCARDEFETWAAWVEGDVAGYVVDRGGPDEDSCWGFYGPHAEKYAGEEARSAAESAAFDRAKREATTRRFLLDPDADPASIRWPAWQIDRMLEAGQEVGATFRYYGGGTEKLRERTGERVRVLRRLRPGEGDYEVGPMYRVRFDEDGLTTAVFEEELTYTHAVEREAVPA